MYYASGGEFHTSVRRYFVISMEKNAFRSRVHLEYVRILDLRNVHLYTSSRSVSRRGSIERKHDATASRNNRNVAKTMT